MEKISKLSSYIAENEPISLPWMRIYQRQVSEVQQGLRNNSYNSCPLEERICENSYGNLENLSSRKINELRRKLPEMIDSFRNML